MLPEQDFRKLCDSLRVLGFATYQDFLASDLWGVFSIHLKNLKPFQKCKVCKRPTYALHHNDYGRLLEPRFIVPVCKDCHTETHLASTNLRNIVSGYKTVVANHRSS